MSTLKRWGGNFFLVAILSVTAFTCENIRPQEEKINNLSATSESCGKEIKPMPEQPLTSDEFSFEEVKIEGNCLKIKTAHGGGCKEVTFQLFQASGIMESYPPQMNLFLKLEDNDHCKALVIQEHSFDLQSLELPFDTDTIIFNLKGYPERLKYDY